MDTFKEEINSILYKLLQKREEETTSQFIL